MEGTLNIPVERYTKGWGGGGEGDKVKNAVIDSTKGQFLAQLPTTYIMGSDTEMTLFLSGFPCFIIAFFFLSEPLACFLCVCVCV